MKRGAIAVVLMLLIASVALGLTRAGGKTDDIPSFTVTRASFVQRVTAEGALRAVKATPVIVPEIPSVSFDSITLKISWLAHDGVVLKAGDPIVRFDLADATKQLREAQAELDKTTTQLRKERISSAASITDRAASAALARLVAEQRLRFQDKDPMLFSRNKIRESELDGKLAVATQIVVEHEARSERVLAGSRIQLATIARDRARLALGRAKAALESMEIHAPSDGILVLRRNERGDVPKLGDQMYSGSTIAEIPLLDDMEAELFVLEIDGSGLEVGQPADIVVESRPELAFHGKIRLVDKLAKPRQQRVPVQYFSVVVALDRTSRDVMKPGQRVHARLVLDAEHALVVPRQAVFERAGTSLVYRRGEQGYTAVTVVLGAATAGLVVVKSGLQEGDVIAERDPTHAADAASTEPAKGAP